MALRHVVSRFCDRIKEALKPKLDQTSTIKALLVDLESAHAREQQRKSDFMEEVAELAEAAQMSGAGPWNIGPETASNTGKLLSAAAESVRTNTSLKEVMLREGIPPGAIGATGDIALALENLEWRREGACSWLEFSRWGIQQIILICRLYFIKNPLIRRGVKISAAYVFGRGFEVSSDNQAADDTLKRFFEANKSVFGQVAMSELHERKFYDGNIFWVFFADTDDTGEVKTRTIDATEISEIITNPHDSDEAWFYRRKWAQKNFDAKTGATNDVAVEAYYPALKFDPSKSKAAAEAGISKTLLKINGIDVKWAFPVLHRKCGAVSKWHFGIPLAYPALPWAKAARKLLEDCATVRRSYAQIAWEITTKGGQQAIQGLKQQLGTNVGLPNPVWDTNPTAVAGSTFVSGPGTKMQAMKTNGAGGDPEDVRRYIHWVAMVFGLPETFFADASVGTLATAQSLDRPTELVMLQQQEEWIEDLTTIAVYVLETSRSAASGKLREALGENKNVIIMECKRILKSNGVRVYEKTATNAKQIKVKVNFPAIREGDLPANVKAIVEAMTLDNKGGQVVGMDEKVGIGMLYAEFGVDNYQDILDKQYPAKYDPDRTVEPLPAPIGKAEPSPGGAPQAPGGHDPKPADQPVKERRISRKHLVGRLREALRKLDRAA